MAGEGGRRDAFPWDEVMRFGLGVLRWPPTVFWAATPREIAAAARPARPRGAPATRADLERLLAAHPDPAPGR